MIPAHFKFVLTQMPTHIIIWFTQIPAHFKIEHTQFLIGLTKTLVAS